MFYIAPYFHRLRLLSHFAYKPHSEEIVKCLNSMWKITLNPILSLVFTSAVKSNVPSICTTSTLDQKGCAPLTRDVGKQALDVGGQNFLQGPEGNRALEKCQAPVCRNVGIPGP